MHEQVLIIKHGALGDWILATGAYKAIRLHHPHARITLITESKYLGLALAMGVFDKVYADNRSGIFDTLKILQKIKNNHFSMVYDLQQSDRTAIYRLLMLRNYSYWHGVKKLFKQKLVTAPQKHTIENLGLFLKNCGLDTFPLPDVSWLKGSIAHLELHTSFALIIPGCASHRPQKRWSISGYVDVITWLKSKNIQSIVIGTKTDLDIIQPIIEGCKMRGVESIFYEASLFEIAELARGAKIIFGSDTGPMHIAALEGQSTVVFFCLKESNPDSSKPYKQGVRVLAADNLQMVASEHVISMIEQTLDAYSL